jgi:DNA-binding FadR family transcriptional regulator
MAGGAVTVNDNGNVVEIDQTNVRAIPGYQAVVDYLRREITLGRIRPGDRLPAERKLAAQLGVARETLRQALRILEGSGQVVIHRGAAGGPVVQEALIDPQMIKLDMAGRAESILDLAEFRSITESAAARMSAERRSDDDLARMHEAQAELLAASTKHDSRLADTTFHLAIAASAGNSMLLQSIEDARVKMFAPVDLMSFEFVKDSSYEAHEEILAAIARHDADAAGEAMRAHLATTKLEFERLIGDAAPTS